MSSPGRKAGGSPTRRSPTRSDAVGAKASKGPRVRPRSGSRLVCKPLDERDFALLANRFYSDDERAVLANLQAGTVTVTLAATGKPVTYELNTRYLAPPLLAPASSSDAAAPPPPPTPAPAPRVPGARWLCGLCTFENHEDLLVCEMCDSPAPHAATSSSSSSSAAATPQIPPGQTVLCLHGFGSVCTWATWTKLVPALHAGGLAVLLADLPGFGDSSGRDVQTGVWRKDGPELLMPLLDAWQVRGPVSVVAHCGGAATFLRTFGRYPHRFAGRNHVIHNSIIAQWPDGFEAALVQHRSRVLATWCEDDEHMRWCVAYKHLKQLRASGFPNLDFYDLNPDVLRETGLPVTGWGRQGGNSAYVFRTSEPYTLHALHHLARRRSDELAQPFCLPEDLRAHDIIMGRA